MKKALHEILPSISTALYSTYVAYLYKPEAGRIPVSLHESEKGQKKLQEYIGTYRLVLDDASGEVFADKNQVDIPGTGYEYEILVLLMRLAGERWPLKDVQRRLRDVHEVFRDSESTLIGRLERIENQWSTLLRGLRRRLDRFGQYIQSEPGYVALDRQLTTCLILHGDSRFLKKGPAN